MIDVRGKATGDLITLDDLGSARSQLESGAWAIFRTGWDQYWATDAYLAHPSLDRALAEQLATWHVPLVGIDALNPDSTQRGEAFVHETLLGAGTLIVENLTALDSSPPAHPTPSPCSPSNSPASTAHRSGPSPGTPHPNRPRPAYGYMPMEVRFVGAICIRPRLHVYGGVFMDRLFRRSMLHTSASGSKQSPSTRNQSPQQAVQSATAMFRRGKVYLAWEGKTCHE